MSPDTVSSLFPDRPIRPMPKRRLRERLSPEVADSIKFPPSAHDSIPLFQYPPYSIRETRLGSSSPPQTAREARLRSSISPDLARRTGPSNNAFPARRNGVGVRTGEGGEAVSRSTLVTRSHPEILSRMNGRPAKTEQPLQTNPQPPPSAASSVDGYESFENTNNKKKRKIPTAGDSCLNHSHGLSADVNPHGAAAGSQSPIRDLSGDRLGQNSAATLGLSSTGISGPGRGRFGRSRNGRSPLRALPDGSNTWVGRGAKNASTHWPSTDYEGGGIISSAIANAGKLPPEGQENVSLLQQKPATAKATPTSTQFKFTFDSQVPSSLQWPAGIAQASNSANHDGSSKAASRGSGSSRKKGRRRLERELNDAARHRRRVAAADYFHNPPRLEELWICEFCEYERIFGEPPRQLIRQYELKDRRARQEEAERKRLLEKAKAKSRKAKKNSKAPTKGTSNPSQPDGLHAHELNMPPHPGNGHSTQSEDDEIEGDCTAEYEDDYLEHRPSPGSHIDDGGGRLYHHHHRGVPSLS